MNWRILYIALWILGFAQLAVAQCPNDNTFFVDLTPTGCPGSNSTTCIWGGEYATVSVTAGNDYTFTTCGSLFGDTEITLYNATGAYIAENDDDCGTLSTVTWTATYTGVVWVLVDEWPCLDGLTCFDLEVSCTPGGGGGGCAGGPICTGASADECATACNLGTLPAPTPCVGTSGGIGTPQTWCGSNIGATAANPYTYQLGCQGGGDMPQFVEDVWYTFVPTGNSIDITVTGLTSPSIGLWSGNCAGLAGIGCANGNGSANLLVEPVIPGDTYYIQVSGGSVGDVGDFDLTLINNDNCDICLTEASITTTPAPTNGFYQNGETVTFCYTIDTWVQQNVNWLHGVQVAFGPGWDQSTLTTVPAASQSGSGTWSWYNSTIVSETIVNGSFPPGFYYETTLESGGVNSTADPGDNWGDNAFGGWTFCWTVTTLDCPPGVDGQDLGISVTTSADGESGDWTSFACSPDPSVDVAAIMTCCPDPILQNVIGVDCFSDCDGSITVIGDGTGPYNYVWTNDATGATVLTDNGNAGASTATGLCPGSYTVDVEDTFNGCQADLTVTVPGPTELILTDNGSTDPTCGNSNGQISVSASGGTPAYTYDIGGAGQASGNFTGLDPGTYTVTVTDDNNCTDQISITLNDNSGLVANITAQTNVLCNGGTNGSVTVVGSGSVGPYTYSDDGVNFQAGGTFSGLSAGSFTVTVRDGNNCEVTVAVTITEPPILILNLDGTTDATCGQNNGEIDLSASGGTPPYSFNIGFGAQASGSFTGLAAGSYTATLTDANGCTVLLPVTVNGHSLTASITAQTDVDCFGGSTGSVTVAGSGSVGPYMYSDDGVNFQGGGTFGGLTAGSYTFTVEDSFGCQTTVSTTITEPTDLSGSINSQDNVTCNGDDDGEVTVGGWGGTPPYQYNIGAGNQASGTFTGLAPNSYTVVITDANGCTFPVAVTITEPFEFVVVENYVTDATCGQNNGEVQVQGWGGTLPMSFNDGSGWQVGNPFTATGLAPGSYTIDAIDGNGCTEQISVTVAAIDEPMISVTAQSDPTCGGATDGSITVLGASGVPPYEYSSDGATFGSSGTFSSLGAGTYTLYVQDANNCQETVSVTLNEPPPVVGNIDNQNDVSCLGLSDGSVTVSASGGTPPYTYDIGSGPQAGGTFTGLSAGSYTVTVLDANACPATVAVTINEPPALAGNLDATTDADCNGASTGSLTVSASGGTPAYTYDIGSGPQASGTFTNLAAGSYTVTIEDAEGCQTTVSATIAEPAVLAISQDAVTDASCGNANGEITVSASGGTPAYTFDIGSGPQASGTFSGLVAGSYTITVVDANGCTDNIAVTVADLSGLTASITTQNDADCNGASTGDVTVTASGSTPPYTYDIGSGAQASGTFTGLAAGSYTVTAEDANGCLFPVSVTIGEPTPVVGNLDSTTDVDCNGASTGSATVSASGGTPPYTYDIGSGPQAGGTFTGLSAGSYTVTVLDANACPATVAVTINEPPALAGNLDATTDADCNGASTGSLTVSASGGTPAYTYDIGSGSQASGTFTNLAAGGYTITVEDAQGCQTTVSATIAEPAVLAISQDAVTDASCGNANGEITVSASGGTPAYTYDIGSGPQASGTFSNLLAGSYTITVVDANGCTDNISVTVADLSGLTASITTQNDADCNGAATGDVTVTASGSTPPYTYDIGSGAQASGTFTGLAAGSYTVTAEDANGCLFPVSVTIGEPTPVVGNLDSTTDVDCNGASTGEATVSASGGTPPYTYDIGSGPQSTGTFTGLSAGSYTVTILDANACPATVAVTINEPPALAGNLDATTDADCNGASTGSLTVSASGGTPAYTYDIGSGPQASGTFTNLAAGSYTVTIEDAEGCQTTVSATIAEPAVLAISQDAVTDASCGNANGEITVSASGGTPAYTYDIGSGPQASGTFSGLVAGSYTITVVDANGCTDNISVTVADLSGLTASITTQNDADCNGAATGDVTVTASGSTPPYTYDIGSGAQASGTFTGLAAGSYTVTAEDANGCLFPVSVTIGEPTPVVGNLDSTTDVDCNGASTGEATVSASGGTPPYTYDIGSGPQSTGTFTGLSAGSYTVTILDANACPATVAVTINEPPALAGNLDATTDADCNGASTGSLTVSASGGTPAYTYDIGSGPQASGTFTNLAAGSYTVTIEDAEGCQTTVSATIAEPAVLAISQDAVTDASCGNANGEITVSASGGTPAYTFDIGSGPQASGTFSGLVAGSYTITVVDANGCTDNIAVTVADLSGLTASITTQNDADCNGASTGDVTVTASGSTPPYTYDIGSGAQASGTFTGLAAGSYTVTAEDANGCLFPVSVTIGEPTPVVGNLDSTTDVDCNGASTGSATVSASGGTPPYTYDIGSGPQAGGTFTGLSAGSYTVTVLDANACPATVAVTINEPPALAGNLDATTDADCNGASTGSLTVSASGGTPAYTYDIGSGSQASGTFTNLAAGGYTITVEDAQGCQTTVSATIAEPAVLAISQDAVTDASCGNANGEITVSASGGTPAYTYDIGSGPQASGTFSNLLAGSYTITVVDANGCTDNISVTVADLSGLTASITTQNDADCNGAATGDVTVTASGSTPPYTYDIGSGAQASGTFTGLAAGSYTVTAEDANGCLFPVSVTIGEPTPVVGNLDSTTDVDCNGASTGEATVSASGGTPPYTYDIGSGPQSTGTFTGLSAGSYTVTILDANACPATVAVTINEPPALAGNLDATTDADCNGASTGSLTVSASGGTPAYTYDIGSGPQASGTFTNLAAGSYTVTIEDAEGCQTTVSATIAEPAVLAISQDAVTDASCGNANGEITVSASGGTPAYTYDIGSGPQASGTFSGLVAGSYTITVVDANGCTDNISVTVADLSGLTASITTQNDADCNGAATGDVTVTASGSTPPYTYDIGSGAQASGTFTGLAAGSYTVTAEDANGCLFPVSVTIGEPTPVVGNLDSTTDVDCNGASTGEATVSASGGTPPYTYDIGSGPQSTGTFTGLSAGSYTVTILDANACPATVAVTINEPPALAGNLDATTDADCNGASTGSLTVSASGGTPAYTYDIGSGPQASGTFTNLAAGSYTVTIEDAEGCQTTVSATIAEPAVLAISQDAVTDASCGNANGEITVSASGGTPAYTYDIGSGPQASGTFSNLLAGSYTITVVDANGCTDNITIAVVDQNGPSAVQGSITDIRCNGQPMGEINISGSGGIPPYLYSIDGVNFGPSGTFSSLVAGTYNLTVQDANLCVATLTVTLTEPTILTGNVISETPADCFGAATGSAEVAGSGGSPPYMYDIGSGPQASGVFSGLGAGTYNVDITDVYNCLFSVNVNITEPTEVLPTVISQTDPTCFGGSDGTFEVAGNGGTSPYTYDIGGGTQASGVFTGLTAGTHSVDVFDANGCLATIAVTLGEPTEVIGNLDTQTDASCSGMADAYMTVSASGGTAPYTFDIGSGAQASGTFSGLTAGTYTVTILDALGCSGTLVVDLFEPVSLTASLVSATDATCYQGADGALEVTAQDGTGPYSFDIGSGPQASGIFTGLTAGSYSVTAMDANGCPVQVPATISEPAELIGSIDSQTDPDCNGATNGLVTVSASGGTSPYTYDIGGGPQGTGDFSGLAAGTHTVTILDANLCQATIDFTLTEPTLVTVSVLSQADPLCWSGADGQIEFEATGGNGPYTYDIGGGSQPSGSFIGLTAGTYTVDVLDATGCPAQTMATLTEPTELSGAITGQVDVSCSGLTDGSVSVAAADGTPGYTYNIGSGAQPTGDFSGLGAGSYTVTITDANGCTVDVPVTITEPVSLTAAIQIQTDVSCFGGSDGTVDVTAQDGSLPYTFDIGLGQQPTGQFTGLSAGSYTVTVMDANGCSVQVPVDILEPTELLGNFVSQSDLSCNSAGDGEFEVSANGGTPTYTYDIGSGPQANGIFNSLSAGLHTVTIIDANLCQTTIDITLTEPTVVTSSIISQTDPLCNGGSDGEFEVSATGGTPTYTYDLGSGAQATGVFTGLPVGTHNVDVLDANGCPDQISVTLSEPTPLTGSISAQTGASCAGMADGTVSVLAADGTPGYTYDIGNGPQPTGDFAGLSAGNYTVTIIDSHGCTFDVPATITEPISLSAAILTQSEVSCYQGSDGSVEITAQDGTQPYTFDIGGGTQPTGVFPGLAAGSYTVTVTDLNGCSVQVPVDVTEPTELFANFVSQTNLTCNASGDGTLEVSASGGTPAYIFDIGSGAQASGIFGSLPAGLHTITVVDANLCQTTIDVTLTEPTVVTSSIINQTDPLCNAGIDGEFEVAASGGTPTYTYDLGYGAQPLGVFTGLAAGTHTVDILDANGCPDQISVTLSEPTPLDGLITTQTNVSCAGFGDGAVTVVASQGTPPYTYDIGTGPQATGDFIGLFAGPYTVVITDGHGCTVDVPVLITEPVSLSASISAQTEVTCFGTATGTVTIDAQNGTQPYTFDIGNGPQPTGDFVDLLAGNYTVEVTDANGCAVQVAVAISEPDTLIGSVADVMNVSCFGGSDGEVSVSAVGGTLPYLFDIGSGAQVAATFSSLMAGSYTIVITDANGCTDQVDTIVTEPTQLEASIFSQQNVSCFGTATGSVIIYASEGTAPYTYDIGNGPQTADNFESLYAGNYTVTVTDAHGCVVDVPIAITEPSVLSGSIIDQVNVLCSGTATGEVTVEGIGGTQPYTYDIGNGAQLFGSFINLTVGQYQVLIEDAQGCQFTVDVDILEPDPLVGVIDSQLDVSCNGLADATVTVVESGGTAPYTFNIGLGPQPSGTFTGLSVGTYTVVILDVNACQFDVPITITEPEPLEGEVASQSEVSCFGGSDATAEISGMGGTLPYMFDIGNGNQPSGNFTGLSAGSYSIQITDANGCQVVVPLVVTEPPVVVANLVSTVDVLCYGGNNGEIVVSSAGGVAPHTFELNGVVQSTGTFTNLYAGDHTVTVTDANGCSLTIDATLDEPEQLNGTIFNQTDVLCYGWNDGTVQIMVFGGVSPYSYDIGYGPQGFGGFVGLYAGDYDVQVTDQNGCMDTVPVTISEPPPLEAEISYIDGVDCAGENSGAFEVVANGGTPSYHYSIGSGAMPSGEFTGLMGGEYNLLITDDNTCQLNVLVDVPVPTPMMIGVWMSSSTICIGDPISPQFDINGGTPGYSFEWFNVVGSDTTLASTDSIPSLLPDTTSLFFVRATDANGCTQTSTDLIANVYTPINLSLITPLSVDTMVCIGEPINYSLSAQGGDGNYGFYLMPDTVALENFPYTHFAESESVVQFMATDGCGQTDQIQSNVSHHPLPDLTFVASPTSGCQPLEVEFISTIIPEPQSVTWNFQDGSPEGDGTVVSNTFEDDGSFDIHVSVITEDGCPTDSMHSEVITVHPKPDAGFGMSEDTVYLYDALISFSDFSCCNIQEWSWDFGDGEFDEEQNPMHIYQDTGKYLITLEVMNQFGCLDTAENPLVVWPEFTFYIPNAFTPNNDGWNEGFTGEGEGADWSQYQMLIYDRWGEMIYETYDINTPWDGYYKGNLVQKGVYTYQIVVAELNGKKHRYDGHVTVVR